MPDFGYVKEADLASCLLQRPGDPAYLVALASASSFLKASFKQLACCIGTRFKGAASPSWAACAATHPGLVLEAL